MVRGSQQAAALDPRALNVLRLFRAEIHSSARKHGVPDEDVVHAFEHVVAWIELDDDPPRYLAAGPNRAGNLLELVILDSPETVLVIHAMPLRQTTREELFGNEGR